MKIAVKYIKDYPVFYAWNLDDPEQEKKFHKGVVYDGEDELLYDELSQYGILDIVTEGIFQYLGRNDMYSLNSLLVDAKEIITIQYPTEEEKEEFMINYD